jgi:hypothetical protein
MLPFAQSFHQAQILTRLRRVNPRNIQYIPVYPVKCVAYLTGAVKIIVFVELDQN